MALHGYTYNQESVKKWLEPSNSLPTNNIILKVTNLTIKINLWCTV